MHYFLVNSDCLHFTEWLPDSVIQGFRTRLLSAVSGSVPQAFGCQWTLTTLSNSASWNLNRSFQTWYALAVKNNATHIPFYINKLDFRASLHVSFLHVWIKHAKLSYQLTFNVNCLNRSVPYVPDEMGDTYPFSKRSSYWFWIYLWKKYQLQKLQGYCFNQIFIIRNYWDGDVFAGSLCCASERGFSCSWIGKTLRLWGSPLHLLQIWYECILCLVFCTFESNDVYLWSLNGDIVIIL